MEDVQDSIPDPRPPQAVQSQAARGTIIGKLSTKNMKLLDKPSNLPELPFSRASAEFSAEKHQEVSHHLPQSLNQGVSSITQQYSWLRLHLYLERWIAGFPSHKHP